MDIPDTLPTDAEIASAATKSFRTFFLRCAPVSEKMLLLRRKDAGGQNHPIWDGVLYRAEISHSNGPNDATLEFVHPGRLLKIQISIFLFTDESDSQ